MRLARRTVLAALLVLVVGAPPAIARVTATPIGVPPLADSSAVAGPRLVGDAIVWGRPTDGGYDVVTQRGAQASVSSIPVPGLAKVDKARIAASLEVSDSRVILSLSISGCRGTTTCGKFKYSRLYDAVLTGPLVGGAFAKVVGCQSRSECAHDPCETYDRVDVSGDVIAYQDCQGIHVRDLSPGASPAGRDYPDLNDPRVAGSYLAARPDYDSVDVLNWRTGADAYSLPDGAFTYDVQSDGKVAVRHAGTAAWASLEEPFLHDVGQYETPLEIRFAGDRIAYTLGVSNQGAGFERVDLQGNSVSPETDFPDALDVWALDEFHLDFDGSRLAWIYRNCTRSFAVVWSPDDPAAGEGPPYGDTCPFPRVVPGKGWLDRKHRLRVRIACDDEPGCVGVVNAFGGRLYGQRLDLPYSVAAGRRKTIRIDRTGHLCRTPGGRIRARVAFTVVPEYADRFNTSIGKTETVFVRGHSRGLDRCPRARAA